jgi:hypothetical protein
VLEQRLDGLQCVELIVDDENRVTAESSLGTPRHVLEGLSPGTRYVPCDDSCRRAREWRRLQCRKQTRDHVRRVADWGCSAFGHWQAWRRR